MSLGGKLFSITSNRNGDMGSCGMRHESANVLRRELDDFGLIWPGFCLGSSANAQSLLGGLLHSIACIPRYMTYKRVEYVVDYRYSSTASVQYV